MSEASHTAASDAAQATDVLLDEPEVYAVTLAPHRSLSQRGFLLVMLAIGGVSFVSGMTFLAMGAWPIFGFFGLDVLIIYVAFRANFRSARAREYIRVTPSLVEVRRVPAKGRERTIRLNPFWTRRWREDDEEHGTLDGAPLAGARVTWSLSRTTTEFAPPGQDGFSFGQQLGWWDDEEPGTLDVALISGRETVPVGRFLGPMQKAALASDLTEALATVKRGVTRSTF